MMGVDDFSEISGMRYLDAICEADAPRVAALMKRALAGERVDFEFTASGDGAPAIFASNFVPICDSEGRVAKMMGITEDVTERRAAERRLRESEERYRTIIHATRAGYCLADKSGVVIDVNESLTEILGCPSEALIGQPLDQFLDPLSQTWLKNILAEGGSGVREIALARPGEEKIIRFEVHYYPVEWGGGARSFALVHDITSERLKDRKLLQSQKMEAVGQLTGGIAHDFNNLLGIIGGNAELIESTLGGRHSELAEYVGEICKATTRGAELTRQLLAFSRKQSLHPRALNLASQVEEMLSLVKRTLGEHITISTRHERDLWVCMADPAQVHSAVLNLCINARDALGSGGTLKISTRNISKVEAEELNFREAEYVCITVSDNGHGMSPDTVSQAFEPFFTTKPTGQGTGLGLSMVYGFAYQSGGYATIDSQEEHGTTVRVYLPRTKEQAQPADLEVVRAVEPPTHGHTVLVVEDDASLARVIVAALKRSGCKVLIAGDGDEALSLLRREPSIELLLSDLVLPGRLSGLDVGNECRVRHPRIQRIFMSGYSEPSMLEAQLSGEDTLLHKPFTFRELNSQILIALQRPPATGSAKA